MLRFIILFLVITTGVKLYSQDSKQLAFKFEVTSLEGALLDIESKTDFKFYFQKEWIDTATVAPGIYEGGIDEILTSILTRSNIHFFFQGPNIVLTYNSPIIILDKNDLMSHNTASSEFIFTREYVSSNKDGSNFKTYLIGNRSKMAIGDESLLTGYVKQIATGEPLLGATIQVKNSKIGTITGQNGFYSLKLKNGRNSLVINYEGMELTNRNVIVFSDGSLNIEMEEETIFLDEVTLYADRDENIAIATMGYVKIDVSQMKMMPKFLGESDLTQILLALPGVQNAGEGSAGLNVRGGKVDQNLITLNGGTIYNPFHFFGFFSAFNPDVIGETNIYKGSIPAKFGGRLSSVIDINIKSGNKDEFIVKGGISPITSQLTFEGPIIKNKTSFLAGIRSTYSDWILNRVDDPNIKNSGPFFFDVTLGLDHNYGQNNQIKATTYFSRDRFKLTSDSIYSYFNFNQTINWQHNFTSNLSGHINTSLTAYDFDIQFNEVPETAFDFGFRIRETSGQTFLNYLPIDKHNLSLGVGVKYYEVTPGFISPSGINSEVIRKQIEKEQGIESAIFISDDYTINDRILVNLGLRYSSFTVMGPIKINSYSSEGPRNNNTLLGSISFEKGDKIKTFHGPEIRLSGRYAFLNNSSLKISYNRTRQYVHILSNNISISPIDTWKLSDPNFLPQIGDQVSSGYYKNFKQNTIETSIELYYKKSQNILDYKIGADLVLNELIETDALQGIGRSYGVELLVKKNTGKLTGWLGYTYSRSQQRFNSKFLSEVINGGKYFPTNQEKPHDVSMTANYMITNRYSASINVVYTSGRPITYPTAKYTISGGETVFYGDRNSFRIPDYFRIDIGFNFGESHKKQKFIHGSWSFSVYNLLSRNNVYSIFFESKDGIIQGYKLSVLGAAIPSITYHFRI